MAEMTKGKQKEMSRMDRTYKNLRKRRGSRARLAVNSLCILAAILLACMIVGIRSNLHQNTASAVASATTK